MATNPPMVPASRLKLDVHTTEDATVVRLSGRLTRDDAATFKEQVKGLIPQTKRLVLDLSEVAYMDSSGLGAVPAVQSRGGDPNLNRSFHGNESL